MSNETFNPYQDEPTLHLGQAGENLTLLHRNFDAAGTTKVAITARSGDVEVRHEQTDEIVIEVRSDGVDLTPVRVEDRNGVIAVDIPDLFAPDGRGMSVYLDAIQFSWGSNRPRISATITAPMGLDLDISVKSGDVVIKGESGTVRVDTSSGDIAVEQIVEGQLTTTSGDISVLRSGPLAVKTGSGDVSLQNVGAAQVNTGSGDISVAAVQGSARLSTGSGDVSAGPIQGEAMVQTGSGDVTLERVGGPLAQVRTGAGDVSVGLPRGIPIWQDVKTVVGSVNSSLESLGEPAEGQEHLTLRVSTGAGDVNLQHA